MTPEKVEYDRAARAYHAAQVRTSKARERFTRAAEEETRYRTAFLQAREDLFVAMDETG